MLLLELKVSYDRNSDDAKELTKLATAARTEVWDTTLPFGTDSLRILPEAYWEPVSTMLAAYAVDFRTVSKGSAVMSHTLLPYPILDPATPSALQALLHEHLQEREDLAKVALRLRLSNALNHVAGRMKLEFVGGEAIPRRFHDTLFSNLSKENELCRAFNNGLFQNTSLYAVFDGIESLSGYEPQAVRKDASLRGRISNLCQDLINLLSNA
jgi:hypothetical protein